MAELGEATDPRSLIPGSPDAIVENARVLRGRAQATTNTGEGLKRIDTGAWRGPASDAFHDKFSYEPVKWLQASDSLDTGAVVLETYAETLRWAQGQAGEAIQQCEQGQNATAAAKRQHDQAVAQAEAQNQTNAASSNPARVQAAPFSDSGEAIRQSARDTLNRARQQLIEAGDRTAAALRAESAAAPEDRDWLGDFFSDLVKGRGGRSAGLRKPSGTYCTADPRDLGRGRLHRQSARLGRKGVRIINENELHQIRQRFHDQLGKPTNVIQHPRERLSTGNQRRPQADGHVPHLQQLRRSNHRYQRRRRRRYEIPCEVTTE
jgi:hypothetical protein